MYICIIIITINIFLSLRYFFFVYFFLRLDAWEKEHPVYKAVSEDAVKIATASSTPGSVSLIMRGRATTQPPR